MSIGGGQRSYSQQISMGKRGRVGKNQACGIHMFCRNVCTQSRQVNVSMRQIGEPNVNLPDVTAAWPDCLGDSEGHMLVGRDC